MLNTYIGTKTVQARPMTRGAYNEYRGWQIPADENPSDPGYLVVYGDGYESWSPQGVFDQSYRVTRDGFGFGQAVEAMKTGHKVSRKGWNGKGMYLYLVGPGRYLPTTPAGEAIAKQQVDGRVPYRPYIAMLTAQQDVVPWLASQSDVLEDDWVIVD